MAARRRRPRRERTDVRPQTTDAAPLRPAAPQVLVEVAPEGVQVLRRDRVGRGLGVGPPRHVHGQFIQIRGARDGVVLVALRGVDARTQPIQGLQRLRGGVEPALGLLLRRQLVEEVALHVDGAVVARF